MAAAPDSDTEVPVKWADSVPQQPCHRNPWANGVLCVTQRKYLCLSQGQEAK